MVLSLAISLSCRARSVLAPEGEGEGGLEDLRCLLSRMGGGRSPVLRNIVAECVVRFEYAVVGVSDVVENVNS